MSFAIRYGTVKRGYHYYRGGGKMGGSREHALLFDDADEAARELTALPISVAFKCRIVPLPPERP